MLSRTPEHTKHMEAAGSHPVCTFESRLRQARTWLGEGGTAGRHVHHGGRRGRRCRPCQQNAQAFYHGQQHASKRCRLGC